MDALTNAGASLDLSANMAYKMLLNADGGYTWHGGFDGQVKVLRTNSVSATAFRGFGNPEGCLVAEQMVEHLAQVLGRDPRLLREANMTKEGDHLHYGDMVVEGCTLDECWGELMKKSNYLKRCSKKKSYVTLNKSWGFFSYMKEKGHRRFQLWLQGGQARHHRVAHEVRHWSPEEGEHAGDGLHQDLRRRVGAALTRSHRARSGNQHQDDAGM